MQCCHFNFFCPISTQVSPVPQFWHTTGQTFLCHFNIEYKVPAKMNHQATLDFLSNLTPGSSIYNETVQKLRRSRRHINHKSYFHKRINIDSQKSTNNSVRFNDQTNETIANLTTPSTSHAIKLQHNVEKWKKYKNHMKNKHKSAFNENQTPLKVSQLILNDSVVVTDCKHLMLYSFLFAGVYAVFAICLIHFLFMTESAVFAVAVVSASLPVSGIFWSLFELTTTDFVGKYIGPIDEMRRHYFCAVLSFYTSPPFPAGVSFSKLLSPFFNNHSHLCKTLNTLGVESSKNCLTLGRKGVRAKTTMRYRFS